MKSAGIFPGHHKYHYIIDTKSTPAECNKSSSASLSITTNKSPNKIEYISRIDRVFGFQEQSYESD